MSAETHDHSHDHSHGEDSWKILLVSAGVCGLAALGGIWAQRVPGYDHVAVSLFVIAFIAGGWDAAVDTISKLRKMDLDIHFLMLAVAIGSAAIGAWWEGATLLFLFSLSEALEGMAMARTEREIRSLFRDAPKIALELLPDGSTREIPAAELTTGIKIRILPGEQVPADARVISGQSACDESTLTGESVPVEKSTGESLFGGTLNTWGVLDAEVTHPVAQSAHARIMHLIREAQASKAPSQRFTDRFGSGYTFAILGFATVMFCIWHFGFGYPAFQDDVHGRSSFYRAMTLLVVCSPCALVISIPSAILTGIAAGARRGILFRGGVAVEKLANVTHLAVDKTGTLTTGELVVTGIEPGPGTDAESVLKAAAALSRHSTHPLSRAITGEFLKSGKVMPEVDSFESLAGQGLRGNIEEKPSLLGKRSLFPADSWLALLPAPEPGLTEVLVSWGDSSGRVLLRDTPRTEAKKVVSDLARQGIQVTMLTGDRIESAQLVAAELGLKAFRAGLHPEDKVSSIRELQANGEVVAMVGDGVNDAPSLATADVSIGMGLRGSDAVLEQADVVLTHDRLDRVVDALEISRRSRIIIRQNLAISLGVVLVLALAALGSKIPLPIGILGHEGSTVIVVMNSLRLLFIKPR
jgi:Zn2+/Cd2+-exporting ATPase